MMASEKKDDAGVTEEEAPASKEQEKAAEEPGAPKKSASLPPPPTREGHPRGLYTLFGAEAWERFSYYGMRALLVLYLTKKIGLVRADALVLYGLYTGLVYLTPLLGGYLADKILGRRKAVLIGGIVMALGQVALMFPATLYPALGLLIAGNGFFKPNISTMVGGLYREGDTRRDGAFTIFYMGINLGALWSPIVCGNLGEKVSFALGFGSAAIGMTLGLLQFALGQKYLGDTGMPPRRAPVREKQDAGPYRSGDLPTGPALLLNKKDYLDVVMWTAGTVAVVWGILYAWKQIQLEIALQNVLGQGHSWLEDALRYGKTGLGIAGIGAVFFQLFRGCTKQEAQQVAVIIILCAFNIFFWMGFEQAGGTMTLFADAQTERNVGFGGMMLIAALIGACAWNFRSSTKDEPTGQAIWLSLFGMFVLLGVGACGLAVYNLVTGNITNIPASQFQAINPLLIVALAPTFSNMWTKLDSGRFKTSTPTKMAIGMIILGLGFVVLFVGQKLAEATGGKTSWLWLFAVYAIHTIGELCLSPIGLSMTTKLAPPRVSSLAMGLWLFSSAVANYLAGSLEKMLEAPLTIKWSSLVIVENFHVPIYGFLIVSSIGPALLLLALTPTLKKWMHGKA